MVNPGNFCQAFTLQKASGSRIIAAPAMSRRDQQETPPPNISQNPPDLTSFKKKKLPGQVKKVHYVQT